MQRVATATSELSAFPHGQAPIFLVESGFRKAVARWSRMDALAKCHHWHHLPSYFLDPEFFRAPEKQHRDRADVLTKRSAALQSTLDKDNRVTELGIADFLLARFLSANRERIGVLPKQGSKVISLPDPLVSALFDTGWVGTSRDITGPATFTQRYARLMLLERARNRSANYPFIETANWTIRPAEDLSNLSDPDVESSHDFDAGFLASLADGHLVVRSRLPAEVDIQKSIEELSGLVGPVDNERVKELATEAKRFYEDTQGRKKAWLNRPAPDLTSDFNRVLLANHLGGEAKNRNFVKVWCEFLEMIPQADGAALSKAGRRPSVKRG